MSRATQAPSCLDAGISPTGLSPSAVRLSRRVLLFLPQDAATALQPRAMPKHPRFGLLRVRSPLLAQSLLFSFPPGSEMFQFPGFAPRSAWCRNRLRRVPPFGHPRVDGYLPLTAAFRSLSRPSSPPRAKASFMCPSLLSLFLSPTRIYSIVRTTCGSLFSFFAFSVDSICDLLVFLVPTCQCAPFRWRITDSNR